MLRKILILILAISSSDGSHLSDITEEVFDRQHDCLIAAYGDFNADKQTDIFVISKYGKAVGIHLQQEKQLNFKYKELLTVNETNVNITGVMPGDYDGDVQMDLLITLAIPSSDPALPPKVTVRVYWGNNRKVEVENIYTELTSDQLVDQPLIFDWDADMIPDILAEKQPGNRVIFTAGTKNREFTEISWNNQTEVKFSTPNTNAFLDLNGDFIADLSMAISDENNKVQYEHWLNKDGAFVKEGEPIDIPTDAVVVGQASFVDFNEKGSASMLVPICEDAQCDKSSIWCYDFDEKKWNKVSVDFRHDGKDYTFVLPQENLGYTESKQYMPIQLHIGDFDIDGYPDVIAVMRRKDNNKQYAIPMFNEPCDKCDAKRKLIPQYDTPLNSLSDVVMATFFDFHENGVLDVLTVSYQSQGGKNVPMLSAYKNEFSVDACFVKITVVSGLCNTECADGREPYGVNQPGPSIRYETAHTLSIKQTSSAFLLSRTAHFATPLPYIIFGLGPTPNFIEKMYVGIPSPKGETRSRAFTQIIPNSQLIVIPYPNDVPDKWTMKLFVTPSAGIYATGFALLGTCLACGVIVLILQLLERKEDKVEKQQESQKFHFDAM